MTQYIYVLILFSSVAIGTETDLQLIEAELRLDPVSCMAKAQEINSNTNNDNQTIAACMPVLWSDSKEIDPQILEKH